MVYEYDPEVDVYVSIPIGFSHQLRRDAARGLDPPKLSFNPYRVFSSAETPGASTPATP